jgi:hypothetical protein
MAIQLGYKAGIATDLDGHPHYTHVVYIDLPTGQVSWHIGDNDMHLITTLPVYNGVWDGHTTDEKYQRLSQFTRKA